jgi:hypothetical protein
LKHICDGMHEQIISLGYVESTVKSIASSFGLWLRPMP